ncbi:MAG: ABC transporter substrate-binding protein [Oscillospiraceae bacterium]|nr:ABC transporter substrate-binding protein [Oscillospiraceae bacterium]
MKNLKKLLALMLALLMSLSLVACGGSDAPADEPADEPAAEDAAPADDTAEDEAPAAEVYSIGVIQLVQHEALDAATQGFVDTLIEKGIATEDSIDIQNAQGDAPTCATIVNGFVSSDVDLILANATAALQAAAAGTSEIPILGTSITDYATALEIDDWTGATGYNVSGTSDLAPLDQQAAMLSELFPVADYPNVGILYCAAEPNSKYQSDVVTEALTALGYSVTEYTFSDSNDVAAVTTNACAEADVLYIPTDNTAASCTETINNVAQPAGIPIIAGEEGICKGCGVATLSISYYDIGVAAGEMAYEILVNGADITTMEVQFAAQVTKKYNPTICEALNITPPEGYEAIVME